MTDPAVRAYLKRATAPAASSAEPTPPDERRARVAIIREARAAGATLTHATQRGGLPPSLVLGVMRRDAFRCRIHGDAGEGENGGLQVHHKAKLLAPISAWLGRKGGSNEPNNLVTLCARAHDAIHDKDRAIAAVAEKNDDGTISVEAAIEAHEALKGEK